MDGSSHCSQVLFDLCLTGLDERFEPQWFTVSVFSALRFSHRELPNGEPEEVKSCLPVDGMQGMSNPRFTGFHLQSHVCYPCCGSHLGFAYPLFCRMQHHKVICIAHHL